MKHEVIVSNITKDEESKIIAKLAYELREEIFLSGREAINFKPLFGIWKPLERIIKRGVNIIYKKLVRPHLDEIYDDEIEDDVEEWCKDNIGKVECDPPKDVLNKIVKDVKYELKDEITEKYFTHTFIDALKSINPITVVKTAYKALKRHGWKLGLRIALVIIIGDLIIPTMGAFIHPSLFAILSATPHTEIAVAVVAMGAKIDDDDALEWVKKYEKETGDDLVKDVAFS